MAAALKEEHTVATTLSRPALRYYDGKWRLADWILGYLPAHVCYVEPFGGAASVLLRKPPSELEVYNDLDSGVVNFFRVLRERDEGTSLARCTQSAQCIMVVPSDLLRAIQLTPFAREEHRLSHEPCEDALERARRSTSHLHLRLSQMPVWCCKGSREPAT